MFVCQEQQEIPDFLIQLCTVYLQTPKVKNYFGWGRFYHLLGLIEMHMLVSQFSVFKKTSTNSKEIYFLMQKPIAVYVTHQC